jgi:hypothetical protein
VSESKSPKNEDNPPSDELAVLRAQHTLSRSSTMESLARTRDRLDEESRLRSGIRRERRMRISEMSERLSGMHGAMRKANEILFEDKIQQIETDLRAELEDELERLESEALEREERLLREEMLHRLRREENRLREQLDLERDRRIEAHSSKLRNRLKDEMEIEFNRRKAFLSERLELEAIQNIERMERRVKMDLQESMESQVHRKVEAYRLDQEIQMRERLSITRRERESELEKLIVNERNSLEKELLSDVDIRIQSLEEESERGALAELDRRFRSERETMDVSLALRKQEMTLEKEVEMEQRIASFVKERELEMLNILENKFSKRKDLSKKEIKEIINSLESEIKVKMESVLSDARQSLLETYVNEY